MTTTDEQTQDEQTQEVAFDLDLAISNRVADHRFEQSQKQQQADAERQEKLAKRREYCEQALAKAFPAAIRETLGMEVDNNSVETSNGYPASNYPNALFALDDHLWHITLDYGNGVYINAPDGTEKQTANNDENVDALLLQIGLWREREAERQRRERAQDEKNQRIYAAADAAEPIALQEPASPRMIGDPDDTTVAFILSESISYYDTAVEQMQVKFSGSVVYLSYQDGRRKPKNFSLTNKQFDALVAARDLYRAHLAAQKERQTPDVPF